MSTEQDHEESPHGKSSTLEPGARLGRYLILERVGSGAMGVVYGAYDPELDRRIALKVLDGDEQDHDEVGRARLLREAKVMARLTHPNVIAVHDVGVFEGRVFLAMEFLAGGTLRSWLAAPRDRREVLAVFVAAGKGLAAAHAAGLVHRDFKPENVLLDNEGRPRVVDFGLAREVAPVDGPLEADDGRSTDALNAGAVKRGTWPLHGDPPNQSLQTITRTGTIVGTPAYMAPEQFLGEATDARTDQFSFCVALYEALHGSRPFAGGTVLRFLHDVDSGRLQASPADREVPGWIRRALIRGLAADRAQRWPSMTALTDALEDDPPARLRRRVLLAAASVLLLAALLTTAHFVRQRRQGWERQIAAHRDEALLSSGVGRAKAAELRDLRRRAFAAFDTPDRARGESLWRSALSTIPVVDAAYDRAQEAYEAALVLDPTRQDLEASLADVLYEHLLLAEELRRDDSARVLAVLLQRHDEGGARRAALQAPGVLVLQVRPPTAAVTLGRYEIERETGVRRLNAVPTPRTGDAASTALAPGSYRLVVRAPDRADVIYPFEIGRDQRLVVAMTLPAATSVPRGFTYVPAGEFWFGDADEQLRTGFLGAVPIHRRRTGAYLIAHHEVTYGEWITFLKSLPPTERSALEPNVATGVRGAVQLRETDEGWQLTLQPTSARYTARDGQPIVYRGRALRAREDWARLPVAGISPPDAERYLAWLRATGAVPGARMCSELEWERAARGADDRLFPHGDELHADDANFDQTYGRVDSAFGPDEVGSHPATRSPFEVDDLAGNLWEMVTSADGRGEIVARGGAYYFSSYTCRTTNREVAPPGVHDVTFGLRVCASAGEEERANVIPYP